MCPRWSIWSSVTVLVWLVARSMCSLPESACRPDDATDGPARGGTRHRLRRPECEDRAMAELRWASPRREDDEAWAELLAAIEVVDVRGETYELEDITTEWGSVWAHPDQNARHVWDGDQLVAFVWLTVRPGTRESHKVSMWGGVRPSHRRRGIGTQLFEWA